MLNEQAQKIVRYLNRVVNATETALVCVGGSDDALDNLIEDGDILRDKTGKVYLNREQVLVGDDFIIFRDPKRLTFQCGNVYLPLSFWLRDLDEEQLRAIGTHLAFVIEQAIDYTKNSIALQAKDFIGKITK